ncbi:hypothetical protein GCM10023231_16310 [Olivibacter ginsenosidimutans]|uniref:SRPBCC family protein n=1 Tax=Olivibacter ginsenosidimutans TaxID=1176537 RepID=A0ABP9B0B6_9SPHI
MTIIESKSTVNQPLERVYAFLADYNNHEKLMPENITNWSSNADESSFTIPNMGKLVLKIQTRIPDQEIIIVPAESAPFELKLSWKLQAVNELATEAFFTIAADLNMMMKMLASGPLKKLADFQTTKLKEELERI